MVSDLWPLFFLLHCKFVFSISIKVILLSRVLRAKEKLALHDKVIIISSIY